MTIGETIDEFILECQIKRYSPRTLKSYRNNLNHFFENKRSTQLAEVSAMTIRARLSEYQAAGLKSTYLNSVSFRHNIKITFKGSDSIYKILDIIDSIKLDSYFFQKIISI